MGKESSIEKLKMKQEFITTCMDFLEKNRWFLLIAFPLILVSILIFLSQIFDFDVGSHFAVLWLTFPYGAYFLYREYLIKKRVTDLKNFSEKNSFDFYQEPKEDQISIFKEFKSAKIICNRDKFFNLLIPKDDNDMQPLIVTALSVFGSDLGESSYMTQIFLYKIDTELPKFFIQRKNSMDLFAGEKREYLASKTNGIAIYKFKDIKFPHHKYFFFSEDSNVESAFNDEFIELLKIGIRRKKALINIESDGKNLIFYKQWSRHSIELMDYYSNLFRALKKSLIK